MVTVIGACKKQGTPTCCARKPQYLLSGFYSVDVELGSQPLIQVDPDRAKENMKFTIDYDGFDDLLAPIYQRPLTSRVEKPINYIPSKSEENCLLLTKREAVGSALGSEIRSEFKASTTVIMKPKQDCFAKSASQRGNSAARMAMTRRVHSLLSINPYQGSWNIKIYNNARGEECVFNVELSDKKGMQIQATISKAAARKFYDRFQKGPLKLANKRFKTVQNDYAMIVNENSEVDEARNDNFVLVDEIGAFGNQKELKDAIAVAQTVSSTMSIRSWNDNETILKKGITLADEKEKNVVVFIWSELATGIGQDKYTAGDFQGVPLSSISRSNVMINPGSPDATKTKYWYDSEACTSAFIKPEQTMWYRGLQDSGL